MERLRENKRRRNGRVDKREHLSTAELLRCMTSADDGDRYAATLSWEFRHCNRLPNLPVDNLVSVFNDSVAMCEKQDEDNVRLVAQ